MIGEIVQKQAHVLHEMVKTKSDLIIRVNHEIDTVCPKNRKYYALPELYKHLDCTTVQFLYHGACLPEKRIMVIDEDAKMRTDKMMLRNVLASAMMQYEILGDVMLVREKRV